MVGGEDSEKFLSCIPDGMHEEMSALLSHCSTRMTKQVSIRQGCACGGGGGGCRGVPEFYSRQDA